MDLTGARSSGVVDGFNAPASSGTTDLSTASILVDLDLSSDSSSLSSLSDSAILGSDDEGFLDDMRASSSSFSTFIGNNNNSNNNNKNSKKKAKSKANTVVCPMCFESVPDAHEIESLPRLDLGRLPLREQKRFCRMHKIHAAQRQWRRCGYPDIQWADLPGRVDALVPQLADVVTGRKHSYYRQLLEDAVMAGGRRNQSAVQAFMVGDLGEGLSPGYYGPRGAQILWVSLDISSLLTTIIPSVCLFFFRFPLQASLHVFLPLLLLLPFFLSSILLLSFFLLSCTNHKKQQHSFPSLPFFLNTPPTQRSPINI